MVALINAASALIASVLSGFILMRQAKANRELKEIKESGTETAAKVDGHLKAAIAVMVEAVKGKEHAQGELAGRDFEAAKGKQP